MPKNRKHVTRPKVQFFHVFRYHTKGEKTPCYGRLLEFPFLPLSQSLLRLDPPKVGSPGAGNSNENPKNDQFLAPTSCQVCLRFYAVSTVFQLFNDDSSEIHVS